MTTAVAEKPIAEKPAKEKLAMKDAAKDASAVDAEILAAQQAAVPSPPLVNQPGIIWYENGDRTGKAFPAIVLRRNTNNKTCSICVLYGTNSVSKGYVMGKMVENVHHISDPKLIEHREWRANTGGWDYFDGVIPESARPKADDVLSGI